MGRKKKPDPRLENIWAFVRRAAQDIVGPMEGLAIAEAPMNEKFQQAIQPILTAFLDIADHGPDCVSADVALAELELMLDSSGREDMRTFARKLVEVVFLEHDPKSLPPWPPTSMMNPPMMHPPPTQGFVAGPPLRRAVRKLRRQAMRWTGTRMIPLNPPRGPYRTMQRIVRRRRGGCKKSDI